MFRTLIPASVILSLALAGCSSSSTSNPEKLYDLKGTVTAVNPEASRIKINHEDIPGLMEAMEMPFTVQEGRLMEGIAPGDLVVGKLKVVDGKYIITELRKTGSTAAAEPKAKEDPEAAIKANLARLSPEDRKIAEAQKFCPIGEDRLGDESMGVPIKISLKGETIFLCCGGCKKAAEKDPDGTLKKVAELKKK